MDFKIGDDIDENGAVEHKMLSNRTKIIIIAVVTKCVFNHKSYLW